MAGVYRLPKLAKWIYPGAVSSVNTGEPALCLTFDDGPDPDSTPYIMEILKKHGIKAFFFCTGEKAEKFPEIISMLVNEGNIPGNHTYSHIDGLKVTAKRYLEDVARAAPLTSSVFFRPPYGRMTPLQYRVLSDSYKIVLWDLVAADFAEKITGRSLINGLMKKIRPGSIIALHDKPVSLKKNFLDEFIGIMKDSGYRIVLPEFII